jgi:hypothetical protein
MKKAADIAYRPRSLDVVRGLALLGADAQFAQSLLDRAHQRVWLRGAVFLPRFLESGRSNLEIPLKYSALPPDFKLMNPLVYVESQERIELPAVGLRQLRWAVDSLPESMIGLAVSRKEACHLAVGLLKSSRVPIPIPIAKSRSFDDSQLRPV